MLHNDLIFRYACGEPLNEQEEAKIRSLLAYSEENQKMCAEIKLINDLLESLTNEDKKRYLNDYTKNRAFNNSLRSKTAALLSKVIIYLVAEKEQLNKLGRRILKISLTFDRIFNIELQEYLLINRYINNILTDAETLDLQVKLDSLHDNFSVCNPAEIEEVPDDFIRTITDEIINKPKETEKTGEFLNLALESQNTELNKNTCNIDKSSITEENLESGNKLISRSSFEIRKWRTIAATVTLLIGLSTSFYFGKRKTSPDAIYNNFYEAYITINFEKNAPDVLLNTAMYNYQKGNCEEAKQIFCKLLEKSEYETISRFYLGLTNMELNLFDEAILNFTDESLINSRYNDKSQWYLALCLVKTNDKKMAKYVLNQLASTSNIYQSRSLELLEMLD